MKRDTLEGWKTIATRLSDVSGMDISAEGARRLSLRARDPLPVRRWGRRIAVEQAILDAWAERQVRAVGRAH